MTERTQELRRKSLEARPAVSAERALLLTEFYRDNEGKYSVPVMRALSFLHICRHKTVWLGEGELIVGSAVRSPRRFPPIPS